MTRKFRRDHWVVTYRIETKEGIMLMEFYRGSQAECRRIAENSAARGENDQEKTGSWKPIIGPADSWDEFMEAGVEVYGFEPVVIEAR
jgi:hypothetical protein